MAFPTFFNLNLNFAIRSSSTEPQSAPRKTRDLFKGTCHAKRGTIKDRNNMDLTEVKGIKKRWQEYTEDLY